MWTLSLSVVAALSLFCGAPTASASKLPSIEIAPGVEMPIVGEGSCCGKYNISKWLQAGGTHIDTSCDYGSEPDIGNAVKASGVARRALFLTSKINPEDYGTNVTGALMSQVLEPLQMEYVDLLLMHHAGRVKGDKRPLPPCFDASNKENGTFYQCRIETWKSFIDIRKAGYARAIGVSNWEVRDLQQAYEATGEYPAVNQIENHPYWHTDDIIKFCNDHNITVTAYAPMAAYPRSKMLDDPALKAVAKAHNVSPGQVSLRWSLNIMDNRGIVIPRSQTPSHMAENLDILHFNLTESDMAKLSALPQQKVYDTQCQPWC